MSVTKCIRMKNGKKKIFYRAQVYVSGVRVAGQAFDTQSAAHRWHDEEKDRTENGAADESKALKETTFDECLNRYLEERLSKLDRVSQDSRQVKLRYLRGCPLSGLRMRHLNARAIDLWIAWLLKHETAKCSKRKTFQYDVKFLTAILNWYRNYIDSDFVVPVTKRHREMARYKNVKPRRPDYYVKPEDVRNWIQWLKNQKNPVYFQLATFLMLTGARVGEAAGLSWEEVDLSGRTARIVRIVAWDQRNKFPRLEERTKTDGSVRLLLLPEILVSLLRAMKKEGDGKGLVFKSRAGDLLRYNAIQAAFNAGFKALNLPWRSTHICRHTYATLALLATGDLGGVQAQLGHKTHAMTEKYAKNVALLRSATAEKTAAFLQLNIG